MTATGKRQDDQQAVGVRALGEISVMVTGIRVGLNQPRIDRIVCATGEPERAAHERNVVKASPHLAPLEEIARGDGAVFGVFRLAVELLAPKDVGK